MNIPMYILIFTVLVLTKEAGSITLADQNVIMTLHTYKVSWNEARYICEAENMSLVLDDWLERTNVILFFMENTWPSLVHPWIGLHYGTTTTGAETKWMWPDCVIQNLTYYSNWNLFEPQDSCVYYDYSDGEWFTDSCDEELEFICEKTVGSCSFEERDGFPDLSLNYQFQIISAENNSECQSLCLTEVLSDRNCWAVHLDGDKCKLYHTRDPFLFNSISFISGGSASSFIKRCYSAATDTVNDTPHDPNTNSEPERTCVKTSANRNEQKSDQNATLIVTGTTVPTTNTVAHSATSTSTTVLPVTTDSNVSVLPVQQTSTVTTSPLSTPTTISTLSASTSSSVPAVSAFSASASIVSSSTTTFSATIVISTTSTVSSIQTFSSSAVSSHGTSPTASSPTSTGINTSTTQSVCTCPCSETRSTNMSFVEKLESILTKLRVDKKKLSSTLRKKTSAEDERTSAKSVGYVAIVVACVELSVVFIPDLIKFTNLIYLKLFDS